MSDRIDRIRMIKTPRAFRMKMVQKTGAEAHRYEQARTVHPFHPRESTNHKPRARPTTSADVHVNKREPRYMVSQRTCCTDPFPGSN